MKNDLLHPEGLYNLTLRFAFTNITDEDFKSYWDGQPITVKSHQTVELSHHLAVKMVKELTDKVMQGLCLIGGEKTKNQGMMLGVPEQRKIWEEKICRPLESDEESPQVVEMRAQLRAEILAAQNKEVSTTPVQVPTSIGEFAELGKEQTKEEKKELKLKEVINP